MASNLEGRVERPVRAHDWVWFLLFGAAAIVIGVLVGYWGGLHSYPVAAMVIGFGCFLFWPLVGEDFKNGLRDFAIIWFFGGLVWLLLAAAFPRIIP